MAHNIFSPCECASDVVLEEDCKCNCHSGAQGWREGTFTDDETSVPSDLNAKLAEKEETSDWHKERVAAYREARLDRECVCGNKYRDCIRDFVTDSPPSVTIAGITHNDSCIRGMKPDLLRKNLEFVAKKIQEGSASTALDAIYEIKSRIFNPLPIVEPKEFGAMVDASSNGTTPIRQKWLRDGKGIWRGEDGTWTLNFSDLINPRVIGGASE